MQSRHECRVTVRAGGAHGRALAPGRHHGAPPGSSRLQPPALEAGPPRRTRHLAPSGVAVKLPESCLGSACRAEAGLPAAGWRDHGHSCTRWDQGARTRTSPTQISRTGLAPAMARTTVGCCALRPGTTQATSSAFTTRFQVSPRQVLPVAESLIKVPAADDDQDAAGDARHAPPGVLDDCPASGPDRPGPVPASSHRWHVGLAKCSRRRRGTAAAQARVLARRLECARANEGVTSRLGEAHRERT